MNFREGKRKLHGGGKGGKIRGKWCNCILPPKNKKYLKIKIKLSLLLSYCVYIYIHIYLYMYLCIYQSFIIIIYKNKIKLWWSWGNGLVVGSLAALPRGPGFHSQHWHGTPHCLELQFQEIQHFLAFVSTSQMWGTDIYAGQIPTPVNLKKRKKET